MSEFFEPPRPLPPEPERPPTPPWFGPPTGTMPGVVAVELVLAQTDEVAVCVTRLAAYATGFEFEVRALAAPGRRSVDLDPMLFGSHRHRLRRSGIGEALPAEMLRIGVQFADGSKATNTGGFDRGDDPPQGPVMQGGGGSGGGGEWRQNQWVWPLPPPGPVAFVCEWPAVGVPLSRADLDAGLILDAASRAQAIFPDDRAARHEGSSWSMTTYAPAPAQSQSPPE